jgi:predicted transcriptional regulator
MAVIRIDTTIEEQQLVLEVLKKHNNQVIAMSKIAKESKVSSNRIRYIISDLKDLGAIEPIVDKAFNPHYIRYKYRVLKEV